LDIKIPRALRHGFGALIVNVSCAFAIAKYKNLEGSTSKAAFLSARNDAYANVAIIGASVATAFTSSGWQDLIAGVGIAALNINAAHEVW